MFDSVFSNDMRQTLDHFRRSVDQLFSDFYGSGSRFQAGSGSQNRTASTFAPVIETGWNENEMLLRAIVPGVSQENLKVTVQNDQLILEGERKTPEGWDSGYYAQLPYGKLYASITLPQHLNLDQIKCNLHDGVLDIRLPVTESMRPREIPIKSGESQQKAIAA